jgi:rhamnogalacturonyl hydrolase YesR
MVWVNGHSLGRYPEKIRLDSLYVPEVWLKAGQNDIVIFDETGASPAGIKLIVDVASREVIQTTSIIDAKTPFVIPQENPPRNLVTINAGNLAWKRPATASSSSSQETAAGFVSDGDPDTIWKAAGKAGSPGTPNPWIAVDLGESISMGLMEILWDGKSRDYKYTVEGSADGQTWIKIGDQTTAVPTSPDSPSELSRFNFKGETFRHVRVTIIAGRSLGVAEVRVFPFIRPDALLDRIPEIFKFAAQQYQFLLSNLKTNNNQPRTFDLGKLKTVGPKDWTCGFFPGSLWYLFEYTHDATWKAAAQDYTARIESAKDYRGTHDLGFMLNCSYGNGYRITHDSAYRDVLIQGAHSLATRFSPQVGLIRSWDFGSWKYPVIIDNMMNLEFLVWVAREANEPHLRDIAISHADKTEKNHFRADASSFHLVDYDPTSGEPIVRQTHQGYADSSAWARGQAWGLYGYTTMFRETGKTNYLEQAQRIARFIMNHPRLPSDKIPYWDFDSPNIPEAPRDASAAAVMASALIELSGFVDTDFAQQCKQLARQQLLSLSSADYLAKLGENGGFLLRHSVGSFPSNSEVDVPLNYADYYFLEALLRYRNESLKP